CALDAGLDLLRSTEKLRSCGDVEGMKPLEILAGCILAHGNNIHSPVGSGVPIDDRSRGNPYFGSDLTATMNIRGGFARSQGGDLPDRGSGVGVQAVNAVVLRCYDQQITIGSADLYI